VKYHLLQQNIARNKELFRKSNKKNLFYHISNHWEEYITCSRVRTLYCCVGNVWKRFKTTKLAKLYANKNQMSIWVMQIPLFQLENLLMRLRRTHKSYYFDVCGCSQENCFTNSKKIFSTQCEVQDAENWSSDLENKCLMGAWDK